MKKKTTLTGMPFPESEYQNHHLPKNSEGEDSTVIEVGLLEKAKIDKVLKPKDRFIVLEPISELAKEKGYTIKIPKENISLSLDSEESENDRIFSDKEKAIWEAYCIFLIDELKGGLSINKALIKLLKESVKKYGNDIKGADVRVIKILLMSTNPCIKENLD